MGKYDIPAALSYVLKESSSHNSSKLAYVGHSMGTTMFWVACNEHQEFMANSVSLMVGMGPVATVRHMDSPIKYLAHFTSQVEVKETIHFLIYWIK